MSRPQDDFRFKVSSPRKATCHFARRFLGSRNEPLPQDQQQARMTADLRAPTGAVASSELLSAICQQNHLLLSQRGRR